MYWSASATLSMTSDCLMIVMLGNLCTGYAARDAATFFRTRRVDRRVLNVHEWRRNKLLGKTGLSHFWPVPFNERIHIFIGLPLQSPTVALRGLFRHL